MVLRLAAIVALASLLAARESLAPVVQMAYAGGANVLSVCERRPDDCERIAERLKETGVVVAGLASRAAHELRGRFEDAIVQVKPMSGVSFVDRGTLRADDLEPQWRGS